NQQRPGKKRHRPARCQIAGRHPVVLRFATASAALGIKRRWSRHLADFTNSLVPENIEGLVAGHRSSARLFGFTLIRCDEVVSAESRITEINFRWLRADADFDTYQQRIFSGIDL